MNWRDVSSVPSMEIKAIDISEPYVQFLSHDTHDNETYSLGIHFNVSRSTFNYFISYRVGTQVMYSIIVPFAGTVSFANVGAIQVYRGIIYVILSNETRCVLCAINGVSDGSYLSIKYPKVQWVSHLDLQYDREGLFYNLEVDDTSVYIAGLYDAQRSYVARYNRDSGAKVWTKVIAGGSGPNDQFRIYTTHLSGSVLYLGGSYATSTAKGASLLFFNTNGDPINVITSKFVSAEGNTGTEIISSVRTDSDSNIYIASTMGPGTSDLFGTNYTQVLYSVRYWTISPTFKVLASRVDVNQTPMVPRIRIPNMDSAVVFSLSGSTVTQYSRGWVESGKSQILGLFRLRMSNGDGVLVSGVFEEPADSVIVGGAVIPVNDNTSVLVKY